MRTSDNRAITYPFTVQMRRRAVGMGSILGAAEDRD